MLTVVQIIQRYTALPEEVIKDEADLRDDLGADSITMMEILNTIESEYGIEDISQSELAEVRTVGDVKEKLKKYTLSI